MVIKILFLIEGLNLGGRQRQVIELLKGLKERKNIRLCVVSLSNNFHYSYEELNIKTCFIDRSIKKDPNIFIKLYKICKEFQPDIIHSWESMCSVYAMPVANILGTKFINGMIRFAPSKVKSFGSLWIRSKITFPWSDAILANSYAGLKSFKVPKHKSYCIRNGFDL